MRCPRCGSLDTQVKDSRPAEDDTAIRRRRLCPTCGERFTTFERVHVRDLTIIKKSGRRTPFDRDKLARSVEIAFHKRHVTPERLEQLVTGVVRRLEARGESEIDSTVIGEMVMDALARIDPVAYVRYASIYRDFREVEDFKRILADEKISADADDDDEPA